MSMAQNSYAKQHNPYLRKASFAECIDSINRHLTFWKRYRALGLIKRVRRSTLLLNGTREYVDPHYSFDNTLTRISNPKKAVKRIALLFIRPCDLNLMKYI